MKKMMKICGKKVLAFKTRENVLDDAIFISDLITT